MKTRLKRLLILPVAVIVLIVLFVGGVLLYSLNYSIPEQADFEYSA